MPAWYRGERVDSTQLIASYRVDTNATTKGSAHSGRETLYPNGTLLIQNVIQKDIGSYTLLVAKNDLETERQIGHLCVYWPRGSIIEDFHLMMRLLDTWAEKRFPGLIPQAVQY